MIDFQNTNPAMTQKRIKQRKKIILMCLRCEFFIGPVKLTDKGKGWLSPKWWRRYNRLCSFINRNHRRRMVAFLTHVQDFNSIGL